MNTLLKNKPKTHQLILDIKVSAAEAKLYGQDYRKTLANARRLKAKRCPEGTIHTDSVVENLYYRAFQLGWDKYDGSQRFRLLAL